MPALYPVIPSADVERSAEFYRGLLELESTFESDWYVSLASPDGSQQIGLVEAGHESIPEGFQAEPRGLIVTVEVDDVDRIYERAVEAIERMIRSDSEPLPHTVITDTEPERRVLIARGEAKSEELDAATASLISQLLAFAGERARGPAIGLFPGDLEDDVAFAVCVEAEGKGTEAPEALASCGHHARGSPRRGAARLRRAVRMGAGEAGGDRRPVPGDLPRRSRRCPGERPANENRAADRRRAGPDA